MAGYIGASPLSKASYNKEYVVATEGQTLFAISYNPGYLDVLVNGVELKESDYTAIDGMTVVFAVALTEGDEVTFKAWGTFSLADTKGSVESENFSAIDGQTEFNLNSGVALASQIVVFVNGVKQVPASYTFNKPVLTISEPLVEGDVVEVMAFTKALEQVTEANSVLLQNKVINTNLTIPASKNGLSIDPTVSEGVTVTVEEGSVWAIVG